MNEIQIRENGWPVLYVEVLGVPNRCAHLHSFCVITEHLDRPEQYAVVFDARKAGMHRSSSARRWHSGLRRIESDFRSGSRGWRSD